MRQAFFKSENARDNPKNPKNWFRKAFLKSERHFSKRGWTALPFLCYGQGFADLNDFFPCFGGQ